MPKEIERKFIVKKDIWDKIIKPEPVTINQGYLMSNHETTIRIRYTERKGTFTIKGKQKGIIRDEYEYEIPRDEAIEIFQNHSQHKLSKKRYEIQLGDLKWEIDEYTGKLEGLVIAEVELNHEHQSIDFRPDWLGDEVTQDIKFSNAFLATIA